MNIFCYYGNLHKHFRVCNYDGILLQTGYSVVSACMVTLRWTDNNSSVVSKRRISGRGEGIIWLCTIALCGLAAGALFRFNASFIFITLAAIVSVLSAAAIYLRQVKLDCY